MFAEVLSAGLLRGAYLVPLFLAFALVSRHGRYLPLWLPQLGSSAAYATYYLGERMHVRPFLAVSAAVLGTIALALLAHRFLFAGHVERSEAYAALLRGLAFAVLCESILGLLTRGYALAFDAMSPSWSTYVGWPLEDTLRVPDLLTAAGILILLPVLWFLVERTPMGLGYRASASNRALASDYGVHLRALDTMVIVLSALLAGLGGVLLALRYGLTPQMMSGPTLDVVAVAVAIGPERMLWGTLSLLVLGAVRAFCQVVPSLSAFESSVSSVILTASLSLHYLLLPAWRRWSSGRHPAAPMVSTP